MDPALELEAAEGAAPADRGDDFLDSAKAGATLAERLDLPAVALGIAVVHAKEDAGEERSLLAAGAGANLEQDIFVVVGIARGQQEFQPLFDFALMAREFRQIGAGQIS